MDKLKAEEAECRRKLDTLRAEIQEGEKLFADAWKEQHSERMTQLRARLADLEAKERKAVDASYELTKKKEFIHNRLAELIVLKTKAEMALFRQASSEKFEAELEAAEMGIQATKTVQFELDEDIRINRSCLDSIAQLLFSARRDLMAEETTVSRRIDQLKSAQRLRIAAFTETNARLAKAAYLATVADGRLCQKDWLDRMEAVVQQRNQS